MAAKLFDASGALIAQIPGDYQGERIRYKGQVFVAQGWIVPPEDKSGELRYFEYRVPSAFPADIVEIKDDGLPRLAPKRD